eukprot:s1703_g16.t1
MKLLFFRKNLGSKFRAAIPMADSTHLIFVESSGELVAVPVLADGQTPGDSKSDSKSENTSGSSSGSGSRTGFSAGGEALELRQEARSSSTLQSGTKAVGDSSSSGTTEQTTAHSADPSRLSSRQQTQSGRNTRSSGSRAPGATDESIAADPSAGDGDGGLGCTKLWEFADVVVATVVAMEVATEVVVAMEVAVATEVATEVETAAAVATETTTGFPAPVPSSQCSTVFRALMGSPVRPDQEASTVGPLAEPWPRALAQCHRLVVRARRQKTRERCLRQWNN